MQEDKKIKTIYIQLLGEGTQVYRPVPALEIKQNVFEIQGDDVYDSDDEEWEFEPGTQVIVEQRYLDGEFVILATREYKEKKDKQSLYQIINSFISGEINEKAFCDEYYYLFDLAIDYSTLTEKENELFFELSKVVSRFSEYPEDHALDPRAFSSAEELKQKAIEINTILTKKI